MKAEEALKRRCKVDPVMAVLMSRLADYTTPPPFTKESSILIYATLAGVSASRKKVRGVVLFLSEIGVIDFEQNPEKQISIMLWKVNAITLAQQVRKQWREQWKPTDEEIQAFMESLKEGGT